jgi:hypothetical protein
MLACPDVRSGIGGRPLTIIHESSISGSYEVIHLGGQAAVVVPLADIMRLRAFERIASANELEEAEDAAALQDWKAREAVGQTKYVPADEMRHLLDLAR